MLEESNKPIKTQKEIANLLNAHRSSVSRSISLLEEQKLISSDEFGYSLVGENTTNKFTAISYNDKSMLRMSPLAGLVGSSVGMIPLQGLGSSLGQAILKNINRQKSESLMPDLLNNVIDLIA